MGSGYGDLDAETLRWAQLKKLPKAGLSCSGRVRFPAVPALVDDILERLAMLFASVGRRFSAADLEHLRKILERKAAEGFAQTPYAGLIVSYETNPLPNNGLSYKVGLAPSTIEDEYATWVKTRTPPLFGSHPDAKVMDLARSLGQGVPVLDIGAGTGRNTLPLARAGHPTDAVELSPDLAAILRGEVGKEGLGVRVFEGDVLGSSLDLPKRHYGMIILCEVVSHFRHADEVRKLFERTSELLAPGGLLAFSVFLPVEGYEPDALALEFSQTAWCSLFMRADMQRAAEGLGFTLVSDESVFDYEQEHLPQEAWPPTGWFGEWTQGADLFLMEEGEGEPPIDMRWLVYEKS